MIVCSQGNTSRLRNFDDGRNPVAMLLAAGTNAKRRGRKAKERALIQMRLAALLISHYAPRSPLVAKALIHTDARRLTTTDPSLPLQWSLLGFIFSLPWVHFAGTSTPLRAPGKPRFR